MGLFPVRYSTWIIYLIVQMSNVSPNERPPCGYDSVFSLSQIRWMGNCNQANITGSVATVWRNDTVVTNLHSASAPSAPSIRIVEPNFQPECSTYSGSACGDGENGNPYCDIPTPA